MKNNNPDSENNGQALPTDNCASAESVTATEGRVLAAQNSDKQGDKVESSICAVSDNNSAKNNKSEESNSAENTNPKESNSVENTNPVDSNSVENTNPAESNSVENTNPEESNSAENTNPKESKSVENTNPKEKNTEAAAAQNAGSVSAVKSVSEIKILKEKRSWFNTSVNILLLIVIVILVFTIIFMNVFVLCPVRQESMYPTIRDGQRVLLVKTKKVENGDVFVFDSGEKDPETGKDKNLIKRVMACGGDRLLFVAAGGRPASGSDNRVVVLYRDTGDGFQLLDESEYINNPMLMYCMPASDYCKVYQSDSETPDFDLAADYIIEVPSGCFYALGDNRNLSNDSRNIGFVEKKTIIGRMTTKFEEGSFIEKLLRVLYRDKTSA